MTYELQSPTEFQDVTVASLADAEHILKQAKLAVARVSNAGYRTTLHAHDYISDQLSAALHNS